MRSVLVASVVAEHLKKHGPSSINRLTKELTKQLPITKEEVVAGLSLASALGDVSRSHGVMFRSNTR